MPKTNNAKKISEPVDAEQNRSATLEEAILVMLNHREFSTVADLARCMKKTRPSVSRSIHSLIRRGLVRKNGTRPVLTRPGATSARKIGSELPRKLVKLNSEMDRLTERCGEIQMLLAVSNENVTA